ncbi:MAG: RluA family pseudouridine synthase [Candidatus Omnitrophica bacterium]|nr:RluA family pseudouridine synthase [Candidatus Omnitrophota bacterium]
MEKKNYKVEEDSSGLRIDVFLANQLEGHSRTSLKNLIVDGFVSINKKNVKPHHCLKINDEIEITIPSSKDTSLSAENIPLEIIYEDEDVIVVNKPAGLVVHPGAGNAESTLVNALLYHTKELSDVSPERPGIVHRLDKETSGVMVIAKNNFTHLELSKQFKDHFIKRRYIALVKGIVEFKEGVIDLPINRHPTNRKNMAVSFSPGSRPAQTNYKVIKRFNNFTLLELTPQTGRTHQLRVHLAYLKHPILGDNKYGNKKDFPRLALHAEYLGFYHPRKNKFMEFTSPLPKEIKEAVENPSR